MEHLEQFEPPLIEQKCTPHEGAVPKLSSGEIERLISSLRGGWQIAYGHHLSRIYTFQDFEQALDFTVQVGELAGEEGHYPHITVSFGKVEMALFTDAIDGVSKNDFILASKISKLRREGRGL